MKHTISQRIAAENSDDDRASQTLYGTNSLQHVTPRVTSAESVIGGLFGLAEAATSAETSNQLVNDLAKNGNSDVVYTATGRGGILLVCRSVSPRSVWVPSYLCPTMIGRVSREFDVRFYCVDMQLKADLSFTDEVQADDLVLVLDYFGRTAETDLIDAIRTTGATILEDATQSWMSDDVGNRADFVVISLIKSIGVPDGGLVIGHRTGVLPPTESLPPAPEVWWNMIHDACQLRREYDEGFATAELRSVWYAQYLRAASSTPDAPVAMSTITRQLIRESLDIDDIAQRRIANYRTLYSEVGHLALLGSLRNGTVPIGFVCKFKSTAIRDRKRQSLIDALIFPPLHWSFDNVVPNEFTDSHDLAGRVLTLPCDQRYDRSDMMRIVNVLNETAN